MNYIFFDVGGTLLETRGVYGKLAKAFRDEGFAVPVSVLRETSIRIHQTISFPGRTGREFWDAVNTKTALALGVPPTGQLLTRISEYMRNNTWVPFPESKQVINIAVKAGWNVGIISNWDEHLENLLAAIFGTPFFRIVSSYRAGIAKPDERLFRQALEGIDLTTDRVIHVGDSIRNDMVPAETLGLEHYLIDRYSLFPWYRGERMGNLKEIAKKLEVIC